MNSKILRRFLTVCLAVCLLAATAAAQTLTASISGTVTDVNGAAVAGARVTVVNTETGTTVFDGTTSEAGLYNVPSIPVGTYSIAVEATNFKRTDINNVRLTVDQRARVDAQLEAGGVNEVVTVTNENAGQIERETSSISQVLDTNRIRDLPTLDRNPLNLLNLVAGVSAGGSGEDINNQQISINGSRTSNNEFTVDGISVTQGGTGRPAALPSSEALREFRVLTSAYSAEYGRTSGGFVSAVVDSGTSKFRGRIYEFLRNEALNANNFFSNANNRPRQRNRQNLYGIRLDGPLRFFNFGEGGPTFTSGKNTFFLVNYEGLRRNFPINPISTVPDARARVGDFSAITTPILDPLTGLQFRDPSRGTAANPQGLNIIPLNRLDPAATRILNLIPLPNAAGARTVTGLAQNNFINDTTLEQDSDQLNARIDHNFSSTARIFGRFTYIDAAIQGQQNIQGVLGSSGGANTPTKTTQFALGYTQSFTPNLLFEFNGGVVRENFQVIAPSEGIDVPTVLGIQRAPANYAPVLNIAGFTGLGTNNNAIQDQITNTYQAQAAATYVRGNLTTKFGGQYRLNEYEVFFPGNAFAGIYNFNGAFTARNPNGGRSEQALADFLLGLPRNANYALAQPAVTRRNNYWALFLQSDWKATRRLTLNLGLRYDYETPLYIKNNTYSRIDVATGRLLVATNDRSLIGQRINPRVFGNLTPAQIAANPFGANDPRLNQTLLVGEYSDKYLGLTADKNNLGPRVGFAYSFDDKTVLRAAFGMFYTPLFVNFGGSVNFTGFSPTQNFGALNNANNTLPVPLDFTLSQGFPLDLRFGNPFNVLSNTTIGNPLSSAGLSFSEFDPAPYTMQWNFGVQREIFKGTVVDFSYVASRGKHLPLQLIENSVPFELGTFTAQQGGANNATQLARPNPLLNQIFTIHNAGNSQYDSFQAKINRQFGNSFSYSATYTYSKSFDDGSGLFNGTQPNAVAPNRNVIPGFDYRLERAFSSFDRPHVFNASAQIQTQSKSIFLRNFIFNPIVLLRSGTPLTITQATTALGVFFQQRPSFRAGATVQDLYAAQLTSEGTSIRYLVPVTGANSPLRPSGPFFGALPGTTQRVQLAAAEFPGAARNIVRGPGEFSVNISAGRTFKFTERLRFQTRVEFFNVLNRTNFNNPSTALGNIIVRPDGSLEFDGQQFGLITSAKPARQGQVVLRLDF